MHTGEGDDYWVQLNHLLHSLPVSRPLPLLFVNP